jgi:glycine cleavage system regulatory protein
MHCSYIITFISDDRPGLVEIIANTVRKCDGNWQESRLSQLGGKFAGLILVSVPQSGAAALVQALSDLNQGDISVSVTETAKKTTSPDVRTVSLSIIGPDRSGIVQEVSRALTGHRINVIEMDSKVSSAPMSAEMLFEARISASVPEILDVEQLRDSLDSIADQMTLEIEMA